MKSRRPARKRFWVEELEGRLVPSSTGLLNKPVLNAHAATNNSTSSNWSGYAVDTSASAVTVVSGQWTVPTVAGTKTAYSSVWVGIDGDNSGTVEQIGTSEDLSGRTPSYYAWYEMYPAYPINLPLTIQPGDSISASVSYSGGIFSLNITDTPLGGKTQTVPTITATGAADSRSSAEWIVEAPSSNRGILPLANFGTVTFNQASATVSGTPGPINATSGSQAINMANPNGGGSTTSALTNSGTSFTVTFVAPSTSKPKPQPLGFWWFWLSPNAGSSPTVIPVNASAIYGASAAAPSFNGGSGFNSGSSLNAFRAVPFNLVAVSPRMTVGAVGVENPDAATDDNLPPAEDQAPPPVQNVSPPAAPAPVHDEVFPVAIGGFLPGFGDPGQEDDLLPVVSLVGQDGPNLEAALEDEPNLDTVVGAAFCAMALGGFWALPLEEEKRQRSSLGR